MTPPYSDAFRAAWAAYQDGCHSTKEKLRSAKREAWSVWKRLELDDAKHVLEWIKTVDDVYSPGYRPGFQRWIKLHDMTEPPPSVDPQEAAYEYMLELVQAGVHQLTAIQRAEAAYDVKLDI